MAELPQKVESKAQTQKQKFSILRSLGSGLSILGSGLESLGNVLNHVPVLGPVVGTVSTVLGKVVKGIGVGAQKTADVVDKIKGVTSGVKDDKKEQDKTNGDPEDKKIDEDKKEEKKEEQKYQEVKQKYDEAFKDFPELKSIPVDSSKTKTNIATSKEHEMAEMELKCKALDEVKKTNMQSKDLSLEYKKSLDKEYKASQVEEAKAKGVSPETYARVNAMRDRFESKKGGARIVSSAAMSEEKKKEANQVVELH